MTRKPSVLPEDPGLDNLLRMTLKPLTDEKEKLQTELTRLMKRKELLEAGIRKIDRMLNVVDPPPVKQQKSKAYPNGKRKELTPQMREQIVGVFAGKTEVSVREVMNALGCSDSRASLMLKGLREEGLIRQTRFEKQPNQRGVGRPYYEMVK